jgi:hypothetical protein
MRTFMATGLLMVLFACSSSPLKSAGTSCSADSDCAAGLSCLALSAVTDAGCTSLAKACSKACTVNSDCASLGSNYTCFGNCGSTRACGATQ